MFKTSINGFGIIEETDKSLELQKTKKKLESIFLVE